MTSIELPGLLQPTGLHFLWGEMAALMNKKEIIFFDQLGFGWVVDKAVIKMIHANNVDKGVIVEKTLADLLQQN